MTTRRATLEVSAGAILISFAPVWVKLAPVGPTVSGFYRMLFAGLALVLLAFARGDRFRASRGTIGFVVAAGGMFALDIIFWHRSVIYVGPGLSTILGNFQVFALAAYGVLVLREPAHWRLLVAIPLAVTGLVLLVGIDWRALPAAYRLGVVFGLLTAVVYATYLLMLRRSQAMPGRLAPVPNLAVICLVSTGLLAASAWLEGESLAVPTPAGWGILLVYALSAQVAGWILISRGLPGVAASRAGLLLLLQPALAFVWDVVLFARPTDVADLLGAGMALGAIYLGTARGGGA